MWPNNDWYSFYPINRRLKSDQYSNSAPSTSKIVSSCYEKACKHSIATVAALRPMYRCQPTKDENVYLGWVVYFSRPSSTTAAQQQRTSVPYDVILSSEQGSFRSTNVVTHTITIYENEIRKTVSIDWAAQLPKLIQKQEVPFLQQ